MYVCAEVSKVSEVQLHEPGMHNYTEEVWHSDASVATKVKCVWDVIASDKYGFL